MKLFGWAGVALLMAIGLVVTIRTWRITSRQPEPAAAAVPPAPTIDLATTLAEALTYKTVSYDDAPPDPEGQARAFEGFHTFLRTTFPRTLAMAERVAGHSLLVSLGPIPAVTIDGAAPIGGARSGAGRPQAQHCAVGRSCTRISTSCRRRGPGLRKWRRTRGWRAT